MVNARPKEEFEVPPQELVKPRPAIEEPKIFHAERPFKDTAA